MKRRISLFWYAVITLIIVYLIIKFVIPYVSMFIKIGRASCISCWPSSA